MFGLTRREQRWKAEQKIAEVMMPMLGEMALVVAHVRAAEANTDAAELERLRVEITRNKERISELEELLNKAADSNMEMAIKYEAIVQAITDPENQPSQFGTVTLAFHESKLGVTNAIYPAKPAE